MPPPYEGPPPGTVPAMLTFEQWADQATAVDVDGLRLAVHDDEGAGPVVTFLHGYPSSSHDALPLFERLAGDARLVTLDLPGFGASAKPVDHPHSIHGATDAVEGVWAARGITETLVVAHDYSVSVAQELLARGLERAGDTHITSVVWCNGGLWPDLHRQTFGQQLLLDPDHGAEVAAAMDEAALTTGLQGTWGTRRPMGADESHAIWASMARDGGSAQAHRLLHYVADRRRHAVRWDDALGRSVVPMRFVWGDLDPVSGAHVADRLEERLPSWPPGRQIHRLPDVGHWPPLEAPDELAAAVRSLW